jgi:hypothetical protein
VTRRGRILDATVVFLTVSLLYLSFPSRLHLFDGVACAVAVELEDFAHLVHGNHLIYGLLGVFFHRALGLLGARLDALWALQFMNSLLGACGAAALYGLLRVRECSRPVSGLCALGMAVSNAYWIWSTDGNVYVLGALFLILLAKEASAEEPRAYRLALWHALAVLSHGANILAAPAVLWRLHSSSSCRREDISRYMLCAALIVSCAYLCAALFCVQPKDWEGVRVWILGSAVLTPDRSFRWHSQDRGLLCGIAGWLGSSGRAVCALPWLGLPLWAAAAAAPFFGNAKTRAMTVFAGLWLAAYALLFISWEPGTLPYRLTDVPALWLLAAPFLLFLEKKRLLPLAAAGVLALCAVNMRETVLPNSRPENNALLQEARLLSRATPESAWITAENDEEVYWPYFAHRHPLNLRYYIGRETALEGFIRKQQQAGRPVYVTDRSLNRRWSSVFHRFRLGRPIPLGRTTLYLVIPAKAGTQQSPGPRLSPG